MWDCSVTQLFIRNLNSLLNSKCPHTINFKISKELFILGYAENVFLDKILYLILLTAKAFIYRCKAYQIKPSIDVFKTNIKDLYQVHQSLIKELSERDAFENKWKPYTNLFINNSN